MNTTRQAEIDRACALERSRAKDSNLRSIVLACLLGVLLACVLAYGKGY